MTTDELLQVLTDRGLRLESGPDGPRLCGPRTEATPALMKVVKLHRDELVKRLPHLPLIARSTEPEKPKEATIDPEGGPAPANDWAWWHWKTYCDCRNSGVVFSVGPSGNLLAGPRDKVTADLAEQIRVSKRAILGYLVTGQWESVW